MKNKLREKIEKIFEKAGLSPEQETEQQMIYEILSLFDQNLRELVGEEEKKRGHTMPRWRVGNNCAVCGKDISNRDRRASYCSDCA